MTAPTYSDVLKFSKSVERVSSSASKAFTKLAKRVDFSDWTIAAEQLREIVDAIATEYGLAASELGAQWYEYCRSLQFGGRYTASVEEVNHSYVMSDANRAIDRLFDGKVSEAELVGLLADVVTDNVFAQSRDTVIGNLEREYARSSARGDKLFARKCGYSRVCSAGACAFCVLLASQGFVYSSEKSATKRGDGGSYHSNCRCVAVPFSDAKEIPGYGELLDSYEQMYREAEAVRNSGDMPDELRARIAEAKLGHEGKWTPLSETLVIMRYQNDGMH